MTERERLIDLLDNSPEEEYDFILHSDRENLADYLLKNGVIVPPCKVGDTVYEILYDYDNSIKVLEDFVTGVFYDEIGFTIFTRRISNGTLGYAVFLTKAEAEKALKERERK